MQMNNIRSAWTIYKNHLTPLYRHWTVIFSVILMLLFTFFTSLDERQYAITFFSLPIFDVQSDKNSAFQYVFFDYFEIIWGVICLGFVPFKILVPVVQSYTVSNSLWLRLAPTNTYILALYRAMLVLIPTIVFGVVALLWEFLFSIVHGLSFSLIGYPVCSMLAFMLFTGSLSICMAGKPTTMIEIRYAFIFIAFIIPIVLGSLKSKFIYTLNGIYPLVFPYDADELGFETLPGTITAIVIGIAIIILILGINYFRIVSQKH
ncbi:MAG: hypothetical protein ACKV1O_11800 [Saprospiraceae bacterium]